MSCSDSALKLKNLRYIYCLVCFMPFVEFHQIHIERQDVTLSWSIKHYLLLFFLQAKDSSGALELFSKTMALPP